jgi:hypothetical protein
MVERLKPPQAAVVKSDGGFGGLVVRRLYGAEELAALPDERLSPGTVLVVGLLRLARRSEL